MGPVKVNEQVPIAPGSSAHRDKIVWGKSGGHLLRDTEDRARRRGSRGSSKAREAELPGLGARVYAPGSYLQGFKTVVKLALKCLQSHQDILMLPFQRNSANLVPDIHGTRHRFCKMKQEDSFLWTLHGGKLHIVVQGARVTSPLPMS